MSKQRKNILIKFSILKFLEQLRLNFKIVNNSTVSNRLPIRDYAKRVGFWVTVTKDFLVKFDIPKMFRPVKIKLKGVNKCSIKGRAC